MTVAQFPKPESVGHREWGTEDLRALAPGKWTLKEIWMNPGTEGGLQRHHLKDEGGYVLFGSMEIIYDDGTGKLVSRWVYPGDVFRFPTGSVHKARTLNGCKYIEVSTPHFNDREHMEAFYGFDEEAGGLPSTKLEDVEVR